MVKETCCGTAQWANAAQPHLFVQQKVFILIPSKATFPVALEVFVCPFPPIPIADDPAISPPTHTKTHAFIAQSACFYPPICMLFPHDLHAFPPRFACFGRIIAGGAVGVLQKYCNFVRREQQTKSPQWA